MINRVLGFAPVYRLWQSPFAAQKMRPIISHSKIEDVQRVLDIGCGPGTNTAYFRHAYYQGFDLNPSYIENAKRLYPWGNFSVADVTQHEFTQQYDFVLLNSLLHHLNDQQVESVLKAARRSLKQGGEVHIIELVKAPRGIPALLARMDRGDYPRTVEEWRQLFAREFRTEVLEPFPVRGMGMTLWELVYFKGSLLQRLN